MEHYDLIVIGSGPGGQRAAVQAAKLGKKVLLIEKEALGGSCLHKGTIPSKTLREKALQAKTLNIRTASEALAHAMHVVRNEHEVIKNQLTRNHIHTLMGTASFVDTHVIEVKNEAQLWRVHGQYIVIATGTRPFRPKNFDFNHSCVFDSDKVLEIARTPKSLAVICAGVIGCEYASIFAKLGASVTLIERRDTLLRGIDGEVHSALLKSFQTANIRVWNQTEILKVDHLSDHIELHTTHGLSQFEAILVCMGRTGNVEELNLKLAGIEVNDRGLIKVNESYQSSQEHIFAVGDVQGAPGLATSASEQGRIAAATAFGLTRSQFPKIFPYGIYTIPEISYVGLTQEEAVEKKYKTIIGIARFTELARGKILEDEDGFLKLIFCGDSKKLLGAHCLGTGATELIHIAQVALCFDADLEFFIQQIFNYPTLAEAYKVAALNAFNQIHKI